MTSSSPGLAPDTRRRGEASRTLEEHLLAARGSFAHWEKIKDVIDQQIDLMLNLRQSGHPGGSRSKVHFLVTALLSGFMRWDIRHPEKRFGDRFVLGAGHTTPLLYGTLAVFYESLRVLQRESGDPRYQVRGGERFIVTWEDLLDFRHRGGLAGHAEMEGKSLFVKANTGPSGHGLPNGIGQAVALMRAGAPEVKVVAVEGEGGLTAGSSHETRNSGYGLGLSNYYLLLDWNDFGIDPHPTSSIVHGTPDDWFRGYGWRIFETAEGSEWQPVSTAFFRMMTEPNPGGVPSVCWFRTRKGREYGVTDYASHGTPHKPNSEAFWETKRAFAEKYGVEFEGFGQAAPADPAAFRRQTAANMERSLDVLRRDEACVTYLAERLVELGDSVPEQLPTFRLDGRRNPIKDPRLYDVRNYPPELFLKPGAKAPNRQGLSNFSAWINSFCRQHYGRPLFLAMSADLAESTNIAGFAKGFGDFGGWGWFRPRENPEGVLLPQGITEFSNSAITAGIASVNMAEDPYQEFNGFFAACSTYGAFSYLKYGPMRLFSQLAQDCQLKVGKVIWIAGHSGPETAEDARTHFGDFSPGVTQLFPRGQVVNVTPWEANEVPVVLGAALAHPAPIIALHLTRPPIEIPDREALGMASHFEAARGAYLIRDFRRDRPRQGTVLVEGTSSTANVVKILGELDKQGLNVKIVAAVSPELFAAQPAEYREAVLSEADRLDAMAITNRARQLMHAWGANPVTEEYWMGDDWDDRWRTGGSVDEVLDEAHLTASHLLEGIARYAREREARRARLRALLEG